MNQRLFMIQGVFFFAYPNRPLSYYHFAGMIHPSESEPNALAGALTDKFGDSVLSDVNIGDYEVTFAKMYMSRIDIIRCSLSKVLHLPNVWRGTYEGLATGKGQINCLITEVPVEFLSPELVKEGS